MKRSYIFFLSGILCATICSQSIIAQVIVVGPRVGINLSSFSGELGEFPRYPTEKESTAGTYSVEKESKIGYQFGATIRFQLNNKFALQFDPVLSTQGAIERRDTATVEVEKGKDSKTVQSKADPKLIGKYDYKIHYIKVPVVLKYYAFSSYGNGFNIQLGLQVGGTLRRALEIEREETNPRTGKKETKTESFDAPRVNPLGQIVTIDDKLAGKAEALNKLNENLLNAFDFGYIFGVGYDFGFGLSVDLRYDWGQAAIITKHRPFGDLSSFYEDASYRNNLFTLSVSYLISIYSGKEGSNNDTDTSASQ